MVVGQKVICINDEAPAILRQYYTAWVRKGTVYVIRGVFLGVDIQAGPGEVGVYLLGLHNPKSAAPPFPERGFNSNRFRPLEEKSVPLKKVEEV